MRGKVLFVGKEENENNRHESNYLRIIIQLQLI